MSGVEGTYPRHGRLLFDVNSDRKERETSHATGVGHRTVWVKVGDIAISLLAPRLEREVNTSCDCILTLPSFLGQFRCPKCSVFKLMVSDIVK